MVCSNDGCPVVAPPRAGWRFCPVCGRRATQLVIDEKLKFVSDGGAKQIAFSSDDDWPHDFEVETEAGLELVGKPTWFGRSGTQSIDISKLKPGQIGHVTFVVDDGERIDPWTTKAPRRKRVQIWREEPRREVAFEPGLALFSSRRDSIELFLVNRGNAVERITSIDADTGFHLQDPSLQSGFELKPGEDHQKSIVVERTNIDAHGRIRVKGPGGIEITSVPLINLQRGKSKSNPYIVISIDFGTFNTSVFATNTRYNTTIPIPLTGPDGKLSSRVETVVVARGDSFTWKAFEAIGNTDVDGVLRGLKTAVREEIEMTDLGGGYTASVNELLEFYLRQLRERFIEPYLTEHCPVGHKVEYVFTVPVLDKISDKDVSSPEHRRYLARLESAARRASYYDDRRNRTASFMVEPSAAALDIILDQLEQRSDSRVLKDGQRLLVIDAGGGTTDLTLGRIELSGDRISLVDTKDGSVDEGKIQFGGNIVTWELGLWVAHLNEEPTKTTSTKQQLIENRELLRGMFASTAFNTEKGNTDDLFDHLDPQKEEPSGFRKNCWFHRFNRLYGEIERAKCEFSEDPYLSATVIGPNQTITVNRSAFNGAVSVHLVALTKSIKNLLVREEIRVEDVDHVALVGGSARLPQIQERLRSIFGGDRLLALDPQLLGTAVCRGASRKYGVELDIFPISLHILIPGIENSITIVEQGEAISGERKARHAVKTPNNIPDVVRLTYTMGNDEGEIFKIDVPGGFVGTVETIVLSNACIVELASDTGIPRPRTYRFDY